MDTLSPSADSVDQHTATLSPRAAQFVDRFHEAQERQPATVALVESTDPEAPLFVMVTEHRLPISTGGDLHKQAVRGLRKLAGDLLELAEQLGPSEDFADWRDDARERMATGDPAEMRAVLREASERREGGGQ